MGSIVVCGGGAVGLIAAMMLSRDGHDVTVLETDSHPAPRTGEEAWASWGRKGVAQFHQPHVFLTRFRDVIDAELPGLTDRLLAAGCVWVNYLSTPPPSLSDWTSRPDDERMAYVTGRRPVTESVIAAAAEEEPRLTIRRGVRVAGLLSGKSAIPGVPHAAGVRTTAGEELGADLVVDATGRRTRAVHWLLELGARQPQVETEDAGFIYYTRYFTGDTRPHRMGRALMPIGSFSILTLDGDNDTWSVTLFALTRDTPLKALRSADVFDRVVGACPLQAHWLDGQPITDVLAMAGVLDSYRRYVSDGQPVITGFAPLGDAWACTNPSAGRGVSMGAIHAQLLRRTVAAHLDDPATFAHQWDQATEQEVGPFYRNQISADRARVAEMDALRRGIDTPPPDPVTTRFLTAATQDADVWRAVIETVVCTALPQQVLARPGMRERIERNGTTDPPKPPGPDRTELLQLLNA